MIGKSIDKTEECNLCKYLLYFRELLWYKNAAASLSVLTFLKMETLVVVLALQSYHNHNPLHLHQFTKKN